MLLSRSALQCVMQGVGRERLGTVRGGGGVAWLTAAETNELSGLLDSLFTGVGQWPQQALRRAFVVWLRRASGAARAADAGADLRPALRCSGSTRHYSRLWAGTRGRDLL